MRFLRRAWLADRALCVFIVAYWLTWAVCFEYRLFPPDGIGYYSYTQSLVVDGDLSIDEEFRRWRMMRLYRRLTEMGYARNVFAVGTSLLWLPFVAAAHLLSLFIQFFNPEFRADGFGYQYIYAANLGTAVYGFLALLLCYRAALLFASRRAALIAVIAVATLSPFWNYLFFHGSYSHVPDAFALALFVYLLARTEIETGESPRQRSWSVWLLLGLTAGFTVLTRWQNVIVPALIGLRLVLDVILALVQRFSARLNRLTLWESRPMRALFIFSISSLLAFMPQFIVWWMQFGTPVTVPQGEYFINWSRPLPLTVLFSPTHGLYTWTPLLFVATVPGLLIVATRFRWLGVCLIGCFLFQIYINSVVMDISGGTSFGARRFVGLTVVYVLGLAALISRIPRWLSGLFIIASALWTVPLWLAAKGAVLETGRFVTTSQILNAVSRTVIQIPMLLKDMRVHNLERLTEPEWLIGISIFALSLVCLAFARVGLSRLTGVRSEATALLCCVLILDLVVAVGVFRSQPAHARIHYQSQAAMIDFGWYANSRFDWNPFNPDEIYTIYSLSRLRGGLIHWGKIPFRIRQPAGYQRKLPSVATSCFTLNPTIAIDLRRVPSYVIHLALSANYAHKPGAATAIIDVEYTDGTVESRILLTQVDVWDFFASAPPQRVIYRNSVGSVTGYSFPLDFRRVPSRLIIRASPIEGVLRPCIALFGVTQEHAIDPSETSRVGPSTEFSTVTLGKAANANHGRDPFWPLTIANHFPDLRPGLLHFKETPFLILDRDRTPTQGSTLTSAYKPGFRQRIPLAPVRSTSLAFLLDGVVLPLKEYPVAEITIEYRTGSDQTTALIAQRDVWGYFDYRTSERIAWRGTFPQDLTYYQIPMDPTRIPTFVWIKGVSRAAGQPFQSGVAIFAITQTLYVPGSKETNKAESKYQPSIGPQPSSS